MKDQMTTLAMVVAGAGVLAAVGVSATAQGSGQADTYRLVEVNGNALPVVIEEGRRCREELIAGTLELAPDGKWTLETSEREVCGDRVDLDNDRERGTYTVAGQTVTFLDRDGRPEDYDDDPTPDLDVEDLVVGTMSADGLAVRLDDNRTVLTFRR